MCNVLIQLNLKVFQKLKNNFFIKFNYVKRYFRENFAIDLNECFATNQSIFRNLFRINFRTNIAKRECIITV